MARLRLVLPPVLFLLLLANSCKQSSQTKETSVNEKSLVGGGCDGCEAIYDMPNQLSWIDTLPDWHIPGIKIEVSGTIFQSDGRTPAPNVILYVYHTDTSGHYTSREGATGYWSRHGYIRGWMKTDEQGRYKFYTNRPVAYPGANIPAHIHPIVKEPDKNEYYLDEYLFDDDPLLTPEWKSKRENRRGSGIVHPVNNGTGLWVCHRDFILGQNIPVYPM